MTNYKYPIVNRFTESTYVYGKFKNRKLDYDKVFEIENTLRWNFDVYLVYLYVDKDILKKRIIETGEKDISISDIEKLEKYYEDYLSKTKFKYIKVDTSKTVEENAREIVKFIESENDTVVEKIEKLIEDIKDSGLRVSNTLEKCNVKIAFDYHRTSTYELITRLFTYYLMNTGESASSIERYEKYYHDRLKYSLLHNVKKILLEQKQSLSTRQMIYTSNECISCVHLLKRQNKLLVNVYIRSSNVAEVLPLDLVALMSAVDEVINEFDIDVEIISFEVFIGSAHIYIKKGDANGQERNR